MFVDLQPCRASVGKHVLCAFACHIDVGPINLRHNVVNISRSGQPCVNVGTLLTCTVGISRRADSKSTVRFYGLDHFVYLGDQQIDIRLFGCKIQVVCHARHIEIVVKMNPVHIVFADNLPDTVRDQIPCLLFGRIENQTGLSGGGFVFDRKGTKQFIIGGRLETGCRFIVARETVRVDPCLELQVFRMCQVDHDL